MLKRISWTHDRSGDERIGVADSKYMNSYIREIEVWNLLYVVSAGLRSLFNIQPCRQTIQNGRLLLQGSDSQPGCQCYGEQGNLIHI